MAVSASDCRNVATETVTAATKKMSRIAVSLIIFIKQLRSFVPSLW